MTSMVDLLNGEAMVFNKETFNTLLSVLTMLAHKVEHLEQRISELEGKNNE